MDPRLLKLIQIHSFSFCSQEGVHENIYNSMTLPIYCINTQKNIECRSYHLIKQPSTHLQSLDDVPHDRQPSKTYLKTLVKGAIETGVPAHYIEFLKSIRHNCNKVDNFEKHLELGDMEL